MIFLYFLILYCFVIIIKEIYDYYKDPDSFIEAYKKRMPLQLQTNSWFYFVLVLLFVTAPIMFPLSYLFRRRDD